jgi:hypothetical protein
VDGEILKWFVYRGFRSYIVKTAFVDAGLLDKGVLKEPDGRPVEKDRQKREAGGIV